MLWLQAASMRRSSGAVLKCHLLSDCVGCLDDLRSYPRQGAPLGGHIADICIPLLFRQSKVCHFADGTPVLVAQQQIGALEIKVNNALLMKIFHTLQPQHDSQTPAVGLATFCSDRDSVGQLGIHCA